jgi:multiple antibiotic resistance protein
MLLNAHGLVITLSAVILNIMVVGMVFLCSDTLIRVIGQAGSRALSKVMMLLLAAIGIMMVRRGILEIITGIKSP